MSERRRKSGGGLVHAIEKDILALEERRSAAMIAADIATLDRLIADDLYYVHGSSRVDDKKSFLASLQSGTIKFLQIERKDVKVRLYNATSAIVTGQAKINVRSKGEDKKIRIRFTNVWTRPDARGREWKWVTWQATKMP